MFIDTDLLTDLVGRCQRGRADESDQVGDIHVARLGRYVVCFRLEPAIADYSFHPDIWQATDAFSALLAQIRNGEVPSLFST